MRRLLVASVLVLLAGCAMRPMYSRTKRYGLTVGGQDRGGAVTTIIMETDETELFYEKPADWGMKRK